MNLSLIDTDILSEFFRGNENVTSKVNQYLLEYGAVNISIITYYEMLNGLLYKDAKKQLKKFEDFIKLNKIIPLTLKTVSISANIQAELRRNGNQIGHTDTLIAGIAIANQMHLITNNTNHLSRIKNLTTDNWTKQSSIV